MKYALINCKPVPKRLEAELRALGLGADITLNSALRTVPAVQYARDHGCSLSSQQELWDGWVAHRPGFNPANPPGRSTHELRNDGVAFPGPAGMPLRYYQVGIDSSNAPLLCERARRRGWTCTLTYPGNPREGHHVNFRKEPILKIFRNLKRGARGRRVGDLSRNLVYLGFLREVGADGTGHFGAKVEQALKDFQRHYHQKPDGVYGVHSHRQLKAAVRGRKLCRKQAMKIHNKRDREAALEKCSRRFGPGGDR